ncbi:hypothetical protein GIB67_012992 [Kingdonia uniflora]|uniref:Uncharacterized protein n=1 Tax=Kingdonia uniflora TaxID=39325 RepID=A0A7J7MCB9_9MAGN|nr:hypothetical protein GIB67_012992 [Kingdonia uniflora]
MLGSSSRGAYFRCGSSEHWVRDFPWKDIKCEEQGCVGTRTLGTCRQKEHYGEEFLKCYTCKNFQWLKDAIAEADVKENKKALNLKVKVIAKIDLDEFINDCRGKATI